MSKARRFTVKPGGTMIQSELGDYVRLVRYETDIAELRTDLAVAQEKLTDTNIKWAIEVKKLIGDLAAAEKDNTRLEDIIVRFKAGCKITSKQPRPEECYMVIDLQADLKQYKEAYDTLASIMKAKNVAKGILENILKRDTEEALNPKEDHENPNTD